MKSIQIFLLISILQSTPKTTIAMQFEEDLSPTAHSVDENYVEVQLSENFQNQCSTSNEQHRTISPKQHMENVKFIFKQPEIFTIIYEFLFGKTDFDKESKQAMLKAINQSNDFKTIIHFVALACNADTLDVSNIQEEDVTLLGTIPYYRKLLISQDETDGNSFLHNIAEQNLYDPNIRKIISTLIIYGIDLFAKNNDKLTAIEVTDNEELKAFLFREMIKQPLKYASYKGKKVFNSLSKRFEKHVNKHLGQYVFTLGTAFTTGQLLFLLKIRPPFINSKCWFGATFLICSYLESEVMDIVELISKTKALKELSAELGLEEEDEE